MSLVTRELKRWRKNTAPEEAFKEALWYELDAAFVRMYPSMATPSWRRMILFPAAAMVLVVTMGTGTYAYASSSVTSQSVLYPVKRGIESIESRFHGDPESSASFHVRMMERRIEEGEQQMRVSHVDVDSLTDIAEEMHVSVSQVAGMKEAFERRKALLVRLQAERQRYEYLLNRANQAQHEKLIEHNEKLRNTIEQIRVRVDASGLTEEEKGTLLLRLHSNSESVIHSNQ